MKKTSNDSYEHRDRVLLLAAHERCRDRKGNPYQRLTFLTDCVHCGARIKGTAALRGATLPDDLTGPLGLRPRHFERLRKYCDDCLPLARKLQAEAARKKAMEERKKRAAIRSAARARARNLHQDIPPQDRLRGPARLSDAQVIEARALMVEWAGILDRSERVILHLANLYGVRMGTMRRLLYTQDRPFMRSHERYPLQCQELTKAYARRLKMLGPVHKKLHKYPPGLMEFIDLMAARQLAGC